MLPTGSPSSTRSTPHLVRADVRTTTNLVVVVLGDHQPATIVTGETPSHDVPITSSPTTRRCWTGSSGWGWQAGAAAEPEAPVWPMDAFRDRFLAAFGPQPSDG